MAVPRASIKAIRNGTDEEEPSGDFDDTEEPGIDDLTAVEALTDIRNYLQRLSGYTSSPVGLQARRLLHGLDSESTSGALISPDGERRLVLKYGEPTQRLLEEVERDARKGSSAIDSYFTELHIIAGRKAEPTGTIQDRKYQPPRTHKRK